MSNSSNIYEMQTRKTKVEAIVAKASTAFLQRIVNKWNNFDDDIVQQAILELKNRKVAAW